MALKKSDIWCPLFNLGQPGFEIVTEFLGQNFINYETEICQEHNKIYISLDLFVTQLRPFYNAHISIN